MKFKAGDEVMSFGTKYTVVGFTRNGHMAVEDHHGCIILGVESDFVPWKTPIVGKVQGVAVLLRDGSTENWKYSPSGLTPTQLNKIGVIGWMEFTVTVREGDSTEQVNHA